MMLFNNDVSEKQQVKLLKSLCLKYVHVSYITTR